ncbi:hypothetical protein EI42_04921 [Thermosporothrix hazakensis]|uniref:Uncharacterized protein n=2 Tax=Thermosporothrix hazakensis TaxID=644383 RepID=A0A326U0X7_THEHA|nr:hypothetical protein EI42_04921 [Thermosporothrix hazakensis]GCE51095.1 hypothetical protein KTH_59640 [Thermosporothrix hazakensis]
MKQQACQDPLLDFKASYTELIAVNAAIQRYYHMLQMRRVAGQKVSDGEAQMEQILVHFQQRLVQQIRYFQAMQVKGATPT